MVAMAEALPEQRADMQLLACHLLDECKAAKGAPKGIPKEEAELVYLARECDLYYVQVCP